MDLGMVGNCLDRAVDLCKQLSLDAVVITGADTAFCLWVAPAGCDQR